MKIKYIFIQTLIVVAVSANCVFANVCDNVQKYKLKNGQTLIIKEVKNDDIVAIDTYIKTGSRNENEKNNGVAHFLEHLFFKGTTNHQRGEFERILESKGASFNAATSKDYTHYYIKIDSKHFDEAMALHSDMLLNIAIPQNELDMERKVVIEEISRSEDNPQSRVFENLVKVLLKDTPYERRVLGTSDIISTISRDEIFDFYYDWYRPENMVTVVVGNVNPEHVIREVEKNFNKTYTKKAKQNTVMKLPNPAQTEIITDSDDINITYMLMGFRTTGNNNLKEAYSLEIGAQLFANGADTPLYDALKSKENLVLSEYAGNYAMKSTGMFYIGSSFKPDNYDRVFNETKTQLFDFINKPIDEKKLQNIKNSIKRDFIYSNESVMGMANEMGLEEAVGGGLNAYCNFIEIINSITPNDIQKAMKKYIKPENMVVSTMFPKNYQKSEKAEKAEKPVSNISENKKSENTLIETISGIDKYALSNGSMLIFEPNKTNDVVAIEILLKGGKLLDKKAGTSSVLAGTMLKSTQTRNEKQLQSDLDNIGAIISLDDETTYYSLSMKTTKDDFEKAFEILTDILENPAFENKFIKDTKNDLLTYLNAKYDKPLNLAIDKFKEKIYQGTKLNITTDNLKKSIPNITRDDVLDSYERVFDTKNMIISVVGNLDDKKVLEKFSSIKLTSPKFSQIKDEDIKISVPKLTQNMCVQSPKDIQAAWILQGYLTDGLKDEKEYVTLNVINNILGSGFTSRLFENLREKKGLAYEVGSSNSAGYKNGIFLMYIGTNPNNISVVKKDFACEISDLINNKISEKELEDAKSKLKGRYILSQETNATRAYRRAYYELFDKNFKFGYDYPRLIDNVTKEDVINVSKRIFSNPYVMSIVASEEYLKNEVNK